ncbi:MAG: hypothetical protein GC206_17120 [Alphaproteobacteria bacterium]|nr:hypothetical protein [Alphaproteobacteria bacterium]
MPRLKYKATGATRLKRLLKALDPEVTAELKTAVRESAEIMAADARSLVPVDTGDLRDSIEVAIRRDGLSAAIGPGVKSKKRARAVFYGLFVEFGTKGSPKDGIPPMPARPFLGPAFLINKEAAIKRTRAAINAAIRQAAAGAGTETD